MFNIGGIGNLNQLSYLTFAQGNLNKTLGNSSRTLLGDESGGVNFGNGFLSSGWSLSFPIYNYSTMQAWDYKFATEFGRRVVRRDPVILDWNGDGQISTKGRDKSSERISFDVNGDGLMDRTEWVKGDALLVYDANGDGVINNGRELMNEVGINGEQGKYKNGWEKARDIFDTNKDGIIMGEELDKVKIWVDANGDGRTDEGELISAKDAGIYYIDTNSGYVMKRELSQQLDFGAFENISTTGFGGPFYFPTFQQTGGTTGFGQPFTSFDHHGGEWDIPSNFWINPAFL